MLFRAVLLTSLFVAATAHAQAPGEMPPQPIVDNPCACTGESVMANRWAVGLSIGSLSLAPKASPDQTNFNIGELSLRFRATPHLEIELAVAGGSEQLSSGSQLSPRQVNSGALDLRYRFSPEHKWNWWLMGGIGGVLVTEQGATDQDRNNAQRPLLQVGIGLERRFHRFALDAELRAIAVGPDQNSQPGMTTVMGTAQTTAPPPQPTAAPSDGQSGGQLTIGASYYF